ncbi:hypothetical protein BD289DRAFT_458864 [Coniella lustricola]|uniref:Uncharacterized protein n=1 Tax=Coniella lustricola TaxID=2025994 RepID=A0A2T3AHD1_9PEZI|nr:hypothetical protein BD289DRAFT_458864 [Coniella lustricola]
MAWPQWETPKGETPATQQDQGHHSDPRPDKRHQQKLLDIYRTAFNTVITSGNFHAVLQEVKSALFKRDFEAAFGREDYLEAYAARWSPTRSLCYASVLDRISPHLDELTGNVVEEEEEEEEEEEAEGEEAGDDVTDTEDGGETHSSKTDIHDDNDDDDVHQPESHDVTTTDAEPRLPTCLKVLALGGAAAEIVAFGSYLSHLSPETTGAIALLDIAPWSSVVDKLRISLTSPPKLSKFASAAKQAANKEPLLEPSRLQSATFEQHDALALGKEELASMIMALSSPSPSAHEALPEPPAQPEQQQEPQPILVTLLFTLNELFTASGIGKTTTFLLNLTAVLPPGSLLLVVDSPGTYSETTIGKDAKRYPMQWLLDRVLSLKTDDSQEQDGPVWDKIESHESLWFRLAPELRYAIPLEDMRYQMHLYRRGAAAM